MGAISPRAVVLDVINEFGASGATPVTLFNVSNVSSGMIYDKITEANAMLQAQVGLGSTAPSDAAVSEGVKRFEVNYASARLAADLIGVIITDGFNLTTGGISVQRFGAEFQTYEKFIKDHLEIAKWWIQALHPRFFIGNPDNPQGTTERGTPVTTWSVTQSRY